MGSIVHKGRSDLENENEMIQIFAPDRTDKENPCILMWKVLVKY